MALIVSKFGGTSVASPERIKNVAKRLIAMKQEGNDVVAVVSAMGKTTDELVGLAAALNDHPSKREMDMLLSTGEQVSMSLLAMAIQALGYNSISFTGWQAGITTDDVFSSAKIEDINADRIRGALDTGAIVVVAGRAFQPMAISLHLAAAVLTLRQLPLPAALVPMYARFIPM